MQQGVAVAMWPEVHATGSQWHNDCSRAAATALWQRTRVVAAAMWPKSHTLALGCAIGVLFLLVG